MLRGNSTPIFLFIGMSQCLYSVEITAKANSFFLFPFSDPQYSQYELAIATNAHKELNYDCRVYAISAML